MLALEQLLGTVPFSEVTVADISERAGVGRPSFYFYFRSKQAALAALLSDVVRRAARQSFPTLDGRPDEPPRELVERALHQMRAVYEEHRGVLSACAIERHTNPDVAALVDAKMSAAVVVVRALAQRDEDADVRIRLLMSVTMAAVAGEIFGDDSSHDWTATAQVLADLWIESLWSTESSSAHSAT